jgi:hypothetical protein
VAHLVASRLLHALAGHNQLVLSGDVGLTIGLGRHGTADLHLGKKTGVALGWAASKGWCVNGPLDEPAPQACLCCLPPNGLVMGGVIFPLRRCMTYDVLDE